ncbi:MAG: flagellar biosynthetic protein FliO [Gallionellaceae bacterium]
MLFRLFAVFFTFFSNLAIAASETRPAYTPPPDSAVSSGNFLQVILSLLLVLVVIAIVAWVLKRIALPHNVSGNLLKVISGVAVGQRERIVLIEVHDTWLVVGVAPGHVTALHSMPKNVLPPIADVASPEESNKFQSWLKIMMEKRNAA